MTPPRSREIRFDPPYDQIFQGILAFATLAETENALLKLEELRQRFLAASDKKGVGYCHTLARMGRERATMIARNPRVKPEKRLQKQESALWFQIWLETPDLFADWLELRKQKMGS
jgi:hypothetical protein